MISNKNESFDLSKFKELNRQELQNVEGGIIPILLFVAGCVNIAIGTAALGYGFGYVMNKK